MVRKEKTGLGMEEKRNSLLGDVVDEAIWTRRDQFCRAGSARRHSRTNSLTMSRDVRFDTQMMIRSLHVSC